MAGIKTQFPSGRLNSNKYIADTRAYTGTKLKSEEMFDRQFSDRTSLRLTDNVVRLLGLNSGRHAQRRKQSKWAPTP
ncbi:MAG: hypothetical protein CFH36_00210 [Alphaproteobacteria bacterium MarineAlpha9_Bin6]|nr:MAG: hypothetical protein CFH36_00210 [Alphaproteobacteria bacterium MarineAlpha9_Bin6]